NEGRQLPVREMRGKDQRRIASQALEAFGRFEGVSDVAGRMPRWRQNLQAVDMGKFGDNSPEVVPHAAQNVLDLAFRLLRKGGDEVGAADAVLLEAWADAAHE